VRAIIDLYSG
jgi:tetratricopeptide (TPR) repeat protein